MSVAACILLNAKRGGFLSKKLAFTNDDDVGQMTACGSGTMTGDGVL